MQFCVTIQVQLEYDGHKKTPTKVEAFQENK
jgi:hypothetical protein